MRAWVRRCRAVRRHAVLQATIAARWATASTAVAFGAWRVVAQERAARRAAEGRTAAWWRNLQLAAAFGAWRGIASNSQASGPLNQHNLGQCKPGCFADGPLAYPLALSHSVRHIWRAPRALWRCDGATCISPRPLRHGWACWWSGGATGGKGLGLCAPMCPAGIPGDGVTTCHLLCVVHLPFNLSVQNVLWLKGDLEPVINRFDALMFEPLPMQGRAARSRHALGGAGAERAACRMARRDGRQGRPSPCSRSCHGPPAARPATAAAAWLAGGRMPLSRA
jgi:hypothetical protein